VDKGIKPDEIVRCINLNLESNDKTDNYDFSEDSEEEVEKLEKEVFSFDESKNKKIKIPNEDTEYDSDLTNIARRFQSDSVINSNYLDTLKRLKKFFLKNKRRMKDEKESQISHKINLSNQTNLILQNHSTNFYSDSISNIQNETSLLNKKRNNKN
jgi:hypothetical protein